MTEVDALLEIASAVKGVGWALMFVCFAIWCHS